MEQKLDIFVNTGEYQELLNSLEIDWKGQNKEFEKSFDEYLMSSRLSNDISKEIFLQLLFCDFLMSVNSDDIRTRLKQIKTQIDAYGTEKDWKMDAIIFLHCIRGKYYEKVDEIELAIENYEYCYRSLGYSRTLKLELIHKIGRCYMAQNNTNGALSYYIEYLEVYSQDNHFKINAYKCLSRIYMMRGLFDFSKFYLSKMTSHRSFNYEDHADILELVVQLHLFTNEFDVASYHLAKLSKYMRSDTEQILNIITTANIQFHQRNYNTALSQLEYLKKTFEIGEDLTHAYLFSKLGEIYLIKGNFDYSEKYLQQSLVIFKKFAHFQGQSDIYVQFGKLYYSISKLDQSLNNFLEGLNLSMQMNRVRDIVHILFYVIQVRLELDLDINYHLSLMRRWTNLVSDDLMKSKMEFIEVLVLNQSERLIEKGEALRRIKNLNSKDFLEFDFQFQVKQLYCQLLLFEFVLFNNDSNRKQVNEAIGNIYKLSQYHNSLIFVIKCLFLTAKLRLIENEFSNAYLILSQIDLLIEELELSFLKPKLHSTMVEMQRKIDDIKNAETASLGINEQLQIANLTNYMELIFT